MELVDRDRELDVLPGLDFLVGRHESHDLVPLGLGVDELLVPQVLDDIDLGRDPHRAAAAVPVQLEILRPEADRQVTAAILLRRLCGAAGEMERRPAEGQVTFACFGGREVHCRRADERRDEHC